MKLSAIVGGLPALTPFVAPEALQRQTGRTLILRLGANESPFGVSPRAIEAMRLASEGVHNYGDPESYELRQELAKLHRATLDHLVVAPGIDAFLSLFARAYLDPGDSVVTSLGSYPTFEYAVLGVGGIIERVPYAGDAIDLEGLTVAAKRVSAKIVYLANPDNPSGAWHSPQEIADMRRQLPESCLLLLDEAYIDFAPADSEDVISIHDPAVVRLRTFSKAHGIAGARIAYALGHPETVGVLNRIRMHFEVNSVAQAGALASLRDPSFVRYVAEETSRGRAEMSAEATALGLRPLPSATNFLTIDVGSPERSRAILQLLLDHNVFIRAPGAEPLNRCIRVTIGKAEQRNAFMKELSVAVSSAPDCRDAP